MEITNKQISIPIQSWTGRAKRKPEPKIDYYSELTRWLQHAILEAEKNNDFNKKDQLLILLKDL